MDVLSDSRPERYDYFEGLNVIVFLNLLQFQIDKNKEIEDQREIERALAQARR